MIEARELKGMLSSDCTTIRGADLAGDDYGVYDGI